MINNCFSVSSLPTSMVVNRVTVLVLLLVAVLSSYGQQHLQWHNVSCYAPIVKQCKIAFTDDRVFVYVNTGDRDINFWLGEPDRTGVMLVLYEDDAMEFRQALFTEFIEESLKALPANAIVQMHTRSNARQGTEDYEINPLADLVIEAHPVDKELLEQGLSNEELADYYARESEENHVVRRPRGDDRNVTMSGVIEQPDREQAKRQSSTETKQSDGNDGGFDAILEIFLVFLIVCWLFKGLLKAFFASPSKKSSSEKDYEDGPAFFP